MSHFTRIKTRMVEKEYLKLALQDLGYAYQEGDLKIRGFSGQYTKVEIKVLTKNPDYDIGFRKIGDEYEMVADWWGIRDVNKEQFLQQLTQRYAYHATRAKLEEQGFSLVREEIQEGGRIHLVLRRMV